MCEAMGANIINTIAEGVAPYLEELVGARAGLKILSNFCDQRRAKATFQIPVEQLKWKGVEGRFATNLQP